MKKILVLVLVMFALTGCVEPDSTFKNKAIDEQIALQALAAQSIPSIQHFLERKVAAKWVKAWDNDKVISYVYVFMHGDCIGYYLVNGKPISSRSYLSPSNYPKYISSTVIDVEAIAPDGTYGEDNVGWHFFTDKGIAVAVEGIGATILYTNQKLPLNVPKL
jgi:hypothetical protein